MLMIKTTDTGGAMASFERAHPGEVEIYQGVDVPGYLALGPDDRNHESESGVCRIDVRCAAGRYGRDAGPFLFCVGIWTPKAFREEIPKWYEVDHFPLLLECDEWHGGRLVEAPDPTGCQFYALHNLETTAALDSDARKRSRSTEWFQRLAKNDWFDRGFTRALYQRTNLPR